MLALTHALTQARGVLLTAPSDLDADAIGAIEALRLALPRRWPALDVRVVLDEAVPPALRFLCDWRAYALATEVAPAPVDVAVVLDGDPRRLTGVGAHLRCAGRLAMVDHHRSSGDAPVDLAVYDPEEASTTMLVLRMLDRWGVPLSPAIATALYAGLVFDTGAFRYRSATPATLRAGARLVDAGVDHVEVIERILLEQSPDKARLRGAVLQRVRYAGGGRIAYASLGAADTNGVPTGGLVDELVYLAGVELGLLLVERGEGRVKLSLRSRGEVDVARLAASLSPRGGGHVRAAGATMGGTLAAAEEAAVAACVAALTAVCSSCSGTAVSTSPSR